MPNGIVKRLISERGFGFIKPDAGGPDVFFHARSVARDGFNDLAEGDAVAYEARQGDKGPQATSVRPLPSEPPTAPAPDPRRAAYRFLNPYNFVRLMTPLNPAATATNGRETSPANTMAAAFFAAGGDHLPAPAADQPLLGQCPPPPHDRYVGVTGKITCTLENITPLFISNSEGVQSHGAHQSYEFFKLGGEPAIPASSLRGAVRSVFEAATNSCLIIMAGQTRLSHHVPPGDALKLVPARVVHDDNGWSLQLLTGATPFQPGRRPNGPQYAAWVPAYLDRMIRRSRNVPGNTPYGQRRAIRLDTLPHGHQCWARLKQVKHPRRNFTFWNVEELASTQAELSSPQGQDERLAKGYLCINNQNIENKHDERFFFFSGGLDQAPTVPLTAAVREDYRILIEDYQQRHQDRVRKYREKHGDPERPAGGDAAYSRFIVHEQAKHLRHGDLVYAMLDHRQDVEYIVPVSVPRVAYHQSIGEVLAASHGDLSGCTDAQALCPACRVFGWVSTDAEAGASALDTPVAYAGRVSLSHGRRLSDTGTLPPTPLAILSSPKPTTTRFYLHPKHGDLPRQRDAQGGYDGEVRLRGRKLYRHHGAARETEYHRAGGKTDDQNRTVRDALRPGARFEFTIHFDNLALIELGALLWTLELDQQGAHRLGFAKPLGFGSVHIRLDSLEVMDPAGRKI